MVAVVRHFRNYLSAGLIGSLIGLVSFPLLTRSLSVEEYGWLGLVSATLTVFISFGKFGIQSALLRFFSEARAQSAEALTTLLSSIAGLAILLSVLSLAVWLIYSTWIVPGLPDGEMMRRLYYIAAALVPIKILFSITTSVMKADEKSGFLGTVTVSEKAAKLLLIVLIIYTVGATAEWVMASTVLVELVILAWVMRRGSHYLGGSRPRLSVPVLTPLVAFGLPAMAGEMVAVALEVGDRYVIQAFMGGEALGQYAASVNISMYLEWVLILALQSAIVPYYVRLYEERGRAETLRFLNGAFEVYAAVALGVFAVFSAAAPSLIMLLAGERYAPGVIVIPWFAAAFVLLGSVSIAAAGIYIDKRPRALAKWVLVAFVTNVSLNILTVPIWGLQAAAVTTFVSMNVQCLGVYWEAHRTMPVKPPLAVGAISVFAALLALFASRQLPAAGHFTDMVLRGTAATLLYALTVLALSPTLRRTAFERVQAWRTQQVNRRAT
ncbi:MAG: oligosaccharide flippase family protein [Pseudomonadota bacterium]